MDHIRGAEEQIVSERMRMKLNEVNNAAQSQLSEIQDHINFTLQQAYFRCAYECFDRRRNNDEIGNCVEHCSVPVMKASSLVQREMATFQERLQRSLMVCQDKFESSKLKHGQSNSNSLNDLESCVNQSMDESIRTLPHLVGKLKASFGI